MTSTEQRPDRDLRGVFEFPPSADDSTDIENHDGGEVADGEKPSRAQRLAQFKQQLTVPRLLQRKQPDCGESSPSPAADTDDAAAEFVARMRGTSGQRLTTYGFRVAVIAALASGPVALFLNAGSSTPPPSASPPPAAVADTTAQFAASDLAEQFVSAWLTTHRGDEGTLQRFIDLDAGTAPLPAQALFESADTQIAGVRQVPGTAGADTYAVTVSTEVTATGTSTSTRRYFQVPVAVSGKGVRAMAMPTAVPAPSSGLTINLDYSNQLSSTATIVTAAQGFLSAMLTGDGDVTRFTSPGTNLSAITPAPYSSISVTGARTQKSLGDSADTPPDGQRARLLLTISQQPSGAASSSDALTGSYALTMTARAGRWEVSALDPVPAAGIGGSEVDSTLTGDDADNTSGTAQDDTTGSDGTPPSYAESRVPDASADDEASSDDVLPTVTSEPNRPRASTPAAPPSTPSSGGGGSLLGPGGIDLGPR